MDYKNSGVDIEAGYKSVELMKKYVKGTMRPEVLGGLGGFSGAFSMESFKNMEKPTLVSGTDGCGTKVKLAFLLDKHDTIGIDCVATVSYTHLRKRSGGVISVYRRNRRYPETGVGKDKSDFGILDILFAYGKNLCDLCIE